MDDHFALWEMEQAQFNINADLEFWSDETTEILGDAEVDGRLHVRGLKE